MRINLNSRFVNLIFGATVGLLTVAVQDRPDNEDAARELATRSQQDTESLQRAYEFAHDQVRQEAAGRFPDNGNFRGLVDPRANRLPESLGFQSTNQPFANSWNNQSQQQSVFSKRPNINREDLEQLSEIERNLAALAQQLRETADDKDKEAVKAKIQTELEKQYDIYLEQHENPLKELEVRVAKLREDFEWRKKAKTDLVKLRVDTIWYDSQGLGWPAQPQQLSRFPNQNPFNHAPNGFFGNNQLNDDRRATATIPLEPRTPIAPPVAVPRPNNR